MKKALVVCHGYLGDHLFASSIAQKLIEENQFDVVDYVVGFPQVIDLLKLNPYINDVIFNGITPSPLAIDGYDKTIQLSALSFIEPPCIEFQKIAGVHAPSADFKVYTSPEVDTEITTRFASVRALNIPIVAVMNNWQPKAFLFTKDEYDVGVNIPYLGYGGRLRDIPMIVKAMQDRFITIMVGAPEGITQFDTATKSGTVERSLLEEASVLKQCDVFIGAEGGMANLAAGAGCKTILTSDFVHQLYGPNGVIRKIPEPKLGPRYYFQTGHIDLDPYLTDAEVVESFTTLIPSIL